MLMRFIQAALLALAVVIPAHASRPLTSVVDTIHVTTRNITSPAVATIALPAAGLAGNNDNVNRRYQVVYLLNGYTGNNDDYASHTDLAAMAEKHQMIIVCPDGRDSWYWDSPVDPAMQMESFIVDDLIAAVDSRLPTIPRASARGIAGLSMGGHGALWLAARHPDIFSAAGSMSGAVDIASPKYQDSFKIKSRLGAYADNRALWESHTAKSALEALSPDSHPALFLACGKGDIFIGMNNALHRRLLSRGIEHEYIVAEGNHSWPYWVDTLPLIMDFMSSHLK